MSLDNLSTDIGTLSNDVANLNTSVSDLGNIETIATNWAESTYTPDGGSTKSSKSWAGQSVSYSDSAKA